MPFRFEKLAIPDVILIEPKKFEDPRGFFMETYKNSDFIENGINELFVQDNFSRSAKGVLRGLHYQKNPQAQGKLVMVYKGEIFDVAVDIRKGSPTFGDHVSITLSEKKTQMLYIPKGFAHGFCVVSDTADFIYKVTTEYSSENERGISWNEPEIGIKWPEIQTQLSGRDQQLPLLKDADNNFVY